MGVFVTPALILLYLGEEGGVDFGVVVVKLLLRVVLPIAVGQVFQYFVPPVVEFVKEHKKKFKKGQELALVYIVYTVFCKTFEEGLGGSVGDMFLMMVVQFVLLIIVMTCAWFSLKLMFGK